MGNLDTVYLRASMIAVVSVLLVLFVVSGGWAAPVTASDAQTAVLNWLAIDRQPLGSDLSVVVREVRAYTDEQGAPLYYVVCLNPSGYVIVPADDLVEPIIAFSPDGDYEAVPENPMYALVVSDLGERMENAKSVEGGPTSAPDSQETAASEKWSYLLAGSYRQPLGGLGSVSDPRVDPLTTSKWSQTGDRCCNYATYNYYTPPGPDGSASNYPSGCVATAMAQLMRYWQYPTAGIGVHSFTIYICGSSTTRSTRGGDGSGDAYNWAGMDLDPCCPSTTTQQAIGALCFDAGVAVEMDYCSGGSASDTLQSADALKNTFGYGQARKGYNSGSDLPSEPRNRMINANLHAGYPVILGIVGTGGHAVVCDGYGYESSTMYHHINMGWAGSATAWYNLPNIDSSPHSFTSVYKCVYNVFTTGSGEIIAGRVTDGTGSPIEGASVTAGGFADTTDDKGVYALPKVASNHAYTVSVSKSGYTFTPQSVTTGHTSDYSTTCGNKWPIDFVSACAPNPPSNPGVTNVTTSSMRWTWTDNSADETGFKVYADPGAGPPTTLRTTTAANATYWDYNTLSGNCQYCFQVAATNGSTDSAKTSNITKYTLAGPPSYGNNISCDKSVSVWYPTNTVFTFSNPAGFGTCGSYMVSKFKYVFDNNATHTWTGGETDWSNGSLLRIPPVTSSFYLHLRSYNAEGIANAASLDLGPYMLDADLPSTPTVTDDGAMQTGTSQLHATWSSTDSASGICEYQYAIGTQATDPGSGYVVGWTSAGTNTEANESGLSLQYGSIYYWYVKARDCAGNWSETATSDGIAIVQSVSGSVRAAKLLEDGASVGLTSKAVSAVLDDAFYIQDSDAPMGIRVQADSTPAGLAAGDVVDVGGGLLTNSDGERYIQACVWDTSADYAVIPIGMNNEWLGGSDWYYADMTGAGQQGIEDAVGLNNVGLLVRTWGKVVSVVQGQPEDTNQIQSWDFNANPGWTLQGQWAHGTPTGGGSDCGDPTSGYTGTSVVGYNLAGEYPNSMSTTYYATTPAIDCSTCTGVELQFRRWLGVESSAYDHANIQVSNNGSNWTTVWSNTAADMCDGAWTLQTYDLSAIADQQPTVYIRWGMGPTDSTVTYPGWNIDDVVISGLQSHMVTIDDGSGVDVFVVYPQNAELPEVGAYVTITGISSCIRDDQDRVQRLVRALTTP